MRYCLDRFEENIAVIECDDGGKLTYMRVGRDKISQDSREGDILLPDKGGYKADKGLTALHKRQIARKLNALKKH